MHMRAASFLRHARMLQQSGGQQGVPMVPVMFSLEADDVFGA